jgi:hypothetical protein
MAIYQLRTFGDIVNAVKEELGVSSSDTTLINRIKRDVNLVYGEVASEHRWWWLQGHATLQMPAYVSSGSANVTQGSNVATLSVAPTASKSGYKISFEGFSEIYDIESHEAGSVTVRLTELYAGTTNATATYKIWNDKLALPADCKDVFQVWHDHHRQGLEQVGIQEFRRIQAMAPRNESRPTTFCLGDYVKPVQTSTIASLPSLSTRASAGAVKTLVFASAIPTSVVTRVENGEPVRWRISAAGHPSYNGDIFISSISTTSTANDTLTYIGKAEYTESAIADSGMSIKSVDKENDYSQYREMHVYPALYSSRITLNIDYVRDVLPLENDSDEPAIPVQDRIILLYGALRRAWTRNRNDAEANNNFALYQEKLAKMEGKLQENADKPKLAPSKIYMGAKRSSSRTRNLFGGAAFPEVGGGGGGNVVTGTASRAAQYGTDGELEASSISITELSYLDNVTSNVQTQLDGKDALGTASGLMATHESSFVHANIAHSNRTALDAVSGVNTGDETQATIKTKLGAAASGIDGYLVGTDWNAFNSKEAGGTASGLIVTHESSFVHSNIAHSNRTALDAVSGVNTGDETQATIKTKLGAAASGVDGYLTGTDWLTFNGKQAALGFTAVPNSRTVNSKALSADISLNATDIGLGNVTNDAQIAKSIGTTKGDLIGFSASGTPVRLAVGATEGHILTVASGQTAGIGWAAAPSSPSRLGEVIFSILPSAPTGAVACDYKTIGKTGSGADYAGDAYRALFDMIWGMAGLNTSETDAPFYMGTKGAVSAEADWNANKKILLNFVAYSVVPRTAGGTLGPALGAYQADAFQGHWHTIRDSGNTPFDVQSAFSGGSAVPAIDGGAITNAMLAKEAISNGVNGTPRVESETRVKSVGLNPYIYYV